MKEIKAPQLHIGEKIKLFRKKNKLTKKELANLIGKEKPLISHIERTGKVEYGTFKSICIALKTTVGKLDR